MQFTIFFIQIVAGSPIHLHLFTWLCLIPAGGYYSSGRTRSFDVVFDDRLSSLVVHLFKLLVDNFTVEYP